MIASEALKVIALVQAGYPNAKPLPRETQAMWCKALMDEGYDFVDGQVAAEMLPRHVAFFPNLKELLDGCFDARTDRLSREAAERLVLAAQAREALMEQAPDAVRETLATYWDRFGGRERAELEYAATIGDPEARVEAGRRLAMAQIVAEATPAEGQLKPPVPVAAAGRSSCGAAWGTRMRWDPKAKDWCCPSCGSLLADGCTNREASA